MQEGDIVHVVFDHVGQDHVIDNQQGLLVVNPDLLISGTTVVSTVQCMRRYERAVSFTLRGNLRHNE